MDQLAAWQGVCASHAAAWPDESQYAVMSSGQITSQVRFAFFPLQLRFQLFIQQMHKIKYEAKTVKMICRRTEEEKPR